MRFYCYDDVESGELTDPFDDNSTIGVEYEEEY